jgi:HD-GYP domain-containing protein (c-di-GMP phosphodiesterase class II)
VRFPLLAYPAIGVGMAVTGAGAIAAASRPLTALALLGAAALAAELLEEPENARLREPVGQGVFRVASGVDLAAVIVLGPWRGALVAGAAALVARLVRGSWRTAAFESSAFALAALGAGYAFSVGGGHAGRLTLPEDLVPVIALAIAFLIISRGLLELVGGGEALQPDFAAAAAEAGLGTVLALFALHHPWNTLAVVPVALAVNQAHARVRRSRQETLHALETFANIVDERDPYTYRHSIRVASHVDALARALGYPYSDIDRLRWAARLHDLGKVAVDSSVLAKVGKLTPAQWDAVWRAPRLSARLLRRFELSTAEARAVEFHRERFDGRGYYGIAQDDQPLAAHFLIVADAFDAMTSDRPYRPGLSKEEALREIEQNIGTQFHPAVAKAFIAVQLGMNPYDALTPEEEHELRGAAAPRRLSALPGTGELKERPELVALGGLVGVLGGIGLHQPLVAVLGALVTATGLVVHAWVRLRSNRLRGALAAALASDQREVVFAGLSRVLESATHCEWTALVSWQEDGLSGEIELSQGQGPNEHALMSWLVREAESRDEVLIAPSEELGADGAYAALPLRRENSALAGFLVLRAPRLLPRHARAALAGSLDAIGLALAERPGVAAEAELAAI